MAEFVYKAPHTLQDFHKSKKFGRWIIGPYGSGKSTGMIMELARMSAAQAPGPDGIRRSRFAIIRNTLQALKTTTLPDIQQLLRPIITYKVSDSTVQVRTGNIVSDWLLVPLEEAEDQRRLLSMQLTGAFLEEFREINFELVAAISGRVGRYPSSAMGGPSQYGIIGSSNPFAMGTDWFNFLVLNPPKDHQLFQQPSGIGPNAENVEHLPLGYYERLAEAYSPDWCKVHVEGEFGDDLSGTTVFRSTFSYERHVVKGLRPQPMRPLIVGLDLGRTPTALICQMDGRGRLLVLQEVRAEGAGLEVFLAEYLIPVLMSERYAGLKVMLFYDPAGVAKGQYSELNAQDVLRAAGLLNSAPAPTNELDPRLRAVESWLLQMRGDTAALLIDGGLCPDLVTAMRFQYKYKRKRNNQTEDIPTKDHPWSDLADALQYVCLAVRMDLPRKLDDRANRSALRTLAAPVSAAGWT